MRRVVVDEDAYQASVGKSLCCRRRRNRLSCRYLSHSRESNSHVVSYLARLLRSPPTSLSIISSSSSSWPTPYRISACTDRDLGSTTTCSPDSGLKIGPFSLKTPLQALPPRRRVIGSPPVQTENWDPPPPPPPYQIPDSSSVPSTFSSDFSPDRFLVLVLADALSVLCLYRRKAVIVLFLAGFVPSCSSCPLDVLLRFLSRSFPRLSPRRRVIGSLPLQTESRDRPLPRRIFSDSISGRPRS